MFKVPLTFLFDFEHVDDYARQFIFSNFAAAGAKHMVLTDTLISAVFQRPKLTEALQQEIAAAGMTFVDAHAPFDGKWLDMNIMDPEYRKRAVLRQKLAIATAAQFGVDTITIHVGNSCCFPGVPVSTQREYTIDFISQLLPTAEEYGVIICIENIWFPNNTTTELNTIIKTFDSQYLGLCYDAGHANLMRSARAASEHSATLKTWQEAGLDQVEWNDHILEDMLPNVVNCHLHDNNGQGDQHLNIGHGIIDWKHIISLLNQAPRLKNIQSEVIPCRGKESIAEICSAFRKLEEL